MASHIAQNHNCLNHPNNTSTSSTCKENIDSSGGWTLQLKSHITETIHSSIITSSISTVTSSPSSCLVASDINNRPLFIISGMLYVLVLPGTILCGFCLLMCDSSSQKVLVISGSPCLVIRCDKAKLWSITEHAFLYVCMRGDSLIICSTVQLEPLPPWSAWCDVSVSSFLCTLFNHLTLVNRLWSSTHQSTPQYLPVFPVGFTRIW